MTDCELKNPVTTVVFKHVLDTINMLEEFFYNPIY